MTSTGFDEVYQGIILRLLVEPEMEGAFATRLTMSYNSLTLSMHGERLWA